MSNTINVSVIFATYNRSDVIGAVLEQWLAVDRNTRYSYEIICSDDASSDNTVEIIEKFKGLPITILRNEHGGASRARNAALKIAKGEIVIFTGDDIFPEPDFINRHYENHLKFGDKVCTLGRIEWHKDLQLNHLMYHITNVGCEQFGFAGLTPYGITDFRHFYTSNISVSRKELDALDKHFDLTFDKYGFEDIELGYRLHKNDVTIFYDPDILAYHHHIYNDVDKFCNRQMSAGDQIVVFGKLHEDVRYNEVMGIRYYEECIAEYAERMAGQVSERGNEILACTEECKARTRELEEWITQEDKREYRAECSALYQYIFQFSMYLGWGLRLTRDKGLDRSVIAEAAFDYMYLGFTQLFQPVDGIYLEADSVRFSRKRIHVRLETEITGTEVFRLDPYDMPCLVRELRAEAVSASGRVKRLKIEESNGTGRDRLDFSEAEDPQIYLTGIKENQSYHIQVEFDLYDRKSVRGQLQKDIQEELQRKRNYAESIYQQRKLNICIQNRTGKDISAIVQEYRRYLNSAYLGNVILSEETEVHEFRSNFIYEITKSPLPMDAFRQLVYQLYNNVVFGMELPDSGRVSFSHLTEEARMELEQVSVADLLQRRKSYPLLSVVIPSYNHEQYIGEAIESVLNQTYPNLELIIIDDGSRDDSVKRIQSFEDERITLVCQQNAGAHNAINRGLEMAKGDYLAILNSDDIYTGMRFEQMICALEEQKEAEFACSYIQVIDSSGKALGIKEGWRNMEPWVIEHPELSYQATDDFKLNLLMTNFTSTTSNFLFTRSLYEKIGGMRNLRFAHDWDFALRAAEVTECIMVEQPLLKYRVHNTNTISSNRKWMLFEIAWMLATNLERYYNKLIFQEEDAGETIVRLAESLNFQQNDKVFWMIKVFIEAQRAKGIEHPEELLLEDEALRNRFLNYVVE